MSVAPSESGPQGQGERPSTPEFRRLLGLVGGARHMLNRFQPEAGKEGGAVDSPETEKKALELLGLLEKRAIVPRSEEELRNALGTLQLGSLLQAARSPEERRKAFRDLRKGKTSPAGNEDAGGLVGAVEATVRDRYVGAIDREIEKILKDANVHAGVTKLLDREIRRYKAAAPQVSEWQDLWEDETAAERSRAQIASRALAHIGAIVGDDARAIFELSDVAERAAFERRHLVGHADRPTLGFIKTRELVGYREQLKAKGFAETPSRLELQEKIRGYLAAGKKVLLAGATGTGKTKLAVYELGFHSGGFEVASGHEAMTTAEIYGRKVLETDENGFVQTKFSEGPKIRAMQNSGFLLDEADTVGNRTTMRQKFDLNMSPGDAVTIQENGQEAVVIHDQYGEIWTANLHSVKHPDRVDLDPALLRMFESLEVPFMPAEELRDLMLSNFIDPSGLLRLGREDVERLAAFAQAAEQTQKAYNGEENVLTATHGKGKDALEKLFLDPGRVLGMMREWPVAQAKGQALGEFLAEKLEDFLAKPEMKTSPQDLVLIKEILESYSLLTPEETEGRGYTLPSELGYLIRPETEREDDDPFAEDAVEEEGQAATAAPTAAPAAAVAPRPRTRRPRPRRRPAESGDTPVIDVLDQWVRDQRLESRLASPLRQQVMKAVNACKDGTLGFDIDLTKVEFRATPENLALAKKGLESGAMNGVVITAYPTAAQVEDMARKLAAKNGSNAAAEKARLLAMPVTEFLVTHFEERGAIIYDRDRRVTEWSSMRWRRDGAPMHKAFEDVAARTALTRDKWCNANGSATTEFTSLHASVYNSLPAQQTLADVLGTAELAFTNVTQEITQPTPVLDDAGVTPLPQGTGMSFARLMEKKVASLKLTQFLALSNTISTPGDPSTYPNPNWATFEWLDGISQSSAANGYSDSDGLNLGWDDPGDSVDAYRSRSAVS